MCERHYNFMRKYGAYEPPVRPRLPDSERCLVDGCEDKPRSRIAKYCEKHYMQLRRNGRLGPKGRPRLLAHSHGYLKLASPGHPLLTPSETYRVYEHRAQFYEKFGHGPFECAGCAVSLEWDSACVCRQNSDKADNDLGNLEIRCRSCASKKAFEASRPTLEQTHFRFLEFNGVRKTLKDWAADVALKPGTLARRLDLGWPIQKALFTPTGAGRRR